MYFKNGSVCAFKPLPKLASIIEDDQLCDTKIVIHPSLITNWGEQQLGLETGALVAETEFCERVEVPSGEITVYLAGFKGYELMNNKLERHQARFISLMECVGIPPVEMLLLQKAYGVIMGG
ncbi:hypothetical protein [Kaarinaea lacus]